MEGRVGRELTNGGESLCWVCGGEVWDVMHAVDGGRCDVDGGGVR